MKKRFKESRKKNSMLHRMTSSVLSLCLFAALVFIVGAGVSSQHASETSTSQEHEKVIGATGSFGADDSSSINAPKETEETPEIVSDSELGDYEKNVVLVSVSESTDFNALNTILENSDFAQTKEVSSQDPSAGFIEVELVDGISVEQAMSSFENKGLKAQPNFIYHVLEDTVNDWEMAGDATESTFKNEVDTSKIGDKTTTEDSIEKAIPTSSDLTSLTTVNDEFSQEQWALDSLNIYDAWDIQKCDHHAVSVAVIDTGCLTTHEDLRSNILATYNSVSDKTGANAVQDGEDGHGTHVAGIVSAEADNNIGVAGTSYNAGLIIVKASTYSNGKSSFETADLARAYSWLMSDIGNGNTIAELYNVRVVNMSVGGEGSIDDDVLYDKITEAKNAGILTVCAAGNKSSDAKPYRCIPGDYKDCLSVINLKTIGTETAEDGSFQSYIVERSSLSNYNLAVSDLVENEDEALAKAKNVSAPGTGILSTVDATMPEDLASYGEMSGTSMASPAVAGVAALMFACNEDLTPQDVQSVLQDTATDLGTPGWDVETGYGEVNAHAALEALNGVSREESIDFNQVTIDQIDDQTYNAGKVEPLVTVTYQGTTLVRGSDYTLEYSYEHSETDSAGNLIANVGLGTVTVKPLRSGDTGEKSHTFQILPANIKDADFGVVEEQEYVGTKCEPKPIIDFKGKRLELGKDYVLTWENNVEPGWDSAKVVVKGINNFETRSFADIDQRSEKTLYFSIVANFSNLQSMGQLEIMGLSESCFYTGGNVSLSPQLVYENKATHEKKTLKEGVDYKVTYNNNQNPGTATMTITGDKMYAGEIKHTFRIEKKPLDSSDIEIEKIKPKTYTGSAITPAITVKYDQAPGGKVNPSNYTVSYANNKEIGTANITITAKANSGFTGSIKTTFTIEPIRFESDTLTVSGIVNKTYTGANHTQNVVVKLGNKQLIPDTDYTISYSNNKNVGTATMIITGKGHYQGTAKRTFQIYASNSSGGSLKPFSSASISSSHMTRNATGKALAPSITVKYGNTTLKAGTHYYLTYNGSTSVPTKAGSYTVKAIGKQENGYSGEKTVGTFRLLQGPASGTVRFTSMSNSNYVLDAHGASPKIGANVTIWSDNGGNNQKWVLSLGSDGYYTIKSTYDQKFLLDASGATPRQGSNVSIWTTNSGNNQKWILEPSGSSYIIRNAANPNLVLDATGAKPKQGANVTVWGSNNGNNQKWKVVAVKTPSFDANKTYEITSLSNSNYTLDASGATPKRGANVSIWTKNGGKNQRWYLVPDGKGYYTIRSFSNRNYVLDASGAKPKQGANVSIWDSNGGNNQKWKIEQLASGAYVIKSAANQSYVLDASGATPKRGANISVWSANGGNNQKWNIKAV